MEYSLPTEGNYLVVSKTLIEAAALLLLEVSQPVLCSDWISSGQKILSQRNIKRNHTMEARKNEMNEKNELKEKEYFATQNITQSLRQFPSGIILL